MWLGLCVPLLVLVFAVLMDKVEHAVEHRDDDRRAGERRRTGGLKAVHPGEPPRAGREAR
ncbi:hypothetical protein LWP59_20550 [Amycolatopsis acidiphila]|uniref:Uncharacterized protein n=1 Tax=Amycolatopsis acidiphila TaxID=715473 RepID=A0A558A2W4_9PSEU|nr:hypothetical protein [Amycolatopsis acidiphila]TVT18604.1 hypothetical protein FNH06_27060 [Amycolatopsis acidiphila]UIJ56583.1 hypothetical protein LWP59_20550 [Amycolatopsis acidiphila]GHG66541.1 hypothetical protein GCM10017788_24540 [Amycolatopsis acidiphila]